MSGPSPDSETGRSTARRRPTSERLDALGASASLACALHCAALPFVVTLLPLSGLAFLADDRFEWAMMGAAAAIGVASLSWGYRRHRSMRALMLLSGALTLLVVGRIAEEGAWEVPGTVAMVVGGLALAGAHALNARLCRQCPTCAAGRSAH